jgi:penicillin-binding protein 2B
MKTRNKKQIWKLPKKIFAFFLVFIFGLFIQLAHLSLSKNIYGIDMRQFALNRNTTSNKIYATRGSIFDRDGNSLAINVTSYTVIAYLSPTRTGSSSTIKHVEDPEYTAYKLAPILDMSVEKLTSLMSQDLYQVELGPGGRGITELKKQEIEALDLPGIDFIEDQKRYYPNGDFASYIIGYAKKNDDGSIIGEMGIESKYDENLKGTDGYEEYQQDLNGYKIPDTPEIRTNPINGNNIYLTLDSNIQRFVETAVKDNSKKYEPEWMVMAVMDAKTGDILGSSSTPSFDPNIKNITNYENPLASYLFEPGSTMKIFTYMCALETGNYDGNKTYLSGKYKIGDDTVKDWNSGYGWGNISYDLGFEYSSNVGVVNLVNTILTKEQLKECYQKYGFEDITGIELGRELSKELKFRYPIEVANASFGQGILTTPIQHLQALTLISNNGKMLKPHIVERIIDSNTGKTLYEKEKEETERIVSKETINYMKQLMYNVVNNNNEGTTGTRYKIEGLDVIGKTGTAQIYDEKNGGYLIGDRDHIYSFSGMFPKDNPEIIIYAAIKKPNYGNTIALSDSVVSLIKNIAKYKNINTEKKQTNTNIQEYNLENYINKDIEIVKQQLQEKNLNTIIIGNGNTVVDYYPKQKAVSNDRIILITNGNEFNIPNMTNWSKREAKYLLDYLDIKYKLNGEGYVIEQSIPENTIVTPELEITLTLENKIKK